MSDYSNISNEELKKKCFINADKNYITDVIKKSKQLVKEGKYKEIINVTDLNASNHIAEL
ncbi:MAG: hypothetical protein K6E39_04180 [Lachnospiraceae bacterium]|nr:hypothetical protein [Lachnospiraceae bacterium]